VSQGRPTVPFRLPVVAVLLIEVPFVLDAIVDLRIVLALDERDRPVFLGAVPCRLHDVVFLEVERHHWPPGLGIDAADDVDKLLTARRWTHFAGANALDDVVTRLGLVLLWHLTP
jgi:hypothetical protein